MPTVILRVISKIGELVRRRDRRLPRVGTTCLLLAVALVTAACAGSDAATPSDRPVIVVSYPVLGAVVADVVGDQAQVRVLMGNGADPHDWSPSAKDIAAVRNADLVVVNGLDLEEGLHDALDEAEAAGVPVFEATDHLAVRNLEHGDGDQPGDHGDEHAGGDPHFWVDPVSMSSVVDGLVTTIADELGLDVTARATEVRAGLAAVDAQTRTKVATLPQTRRKLVTGHESLGYFADRYGFEQIGAVVPSLSSQAESSAAQLAELDEQIRRAGVSVVFTEIGTPAAVAKAVARETGATLVPLATHTLPSDGKYRTFIAELADRIVAALSA